MPWINACAAEDIEEEDVIRWDHGDRDLRDLPRCPDGEYSTAPTGICTHEHAHLSDGLVMDFEIECPKHNGLFDYRSGERPSARGSASNLKTYPTKIEDGRVMVDVP